MNLVPTLRVGMPSSTLCVVLAHIATAKLWGRGTSRTAFPRAILNANAIGIAGSTLARHRRLRLRIGKALRILIELLLANRTAEVIGLAFELALPGCLLGLNVHSAHGILGHGRCSLRLCDRIETLNPRALLLEIVAGVFAERRDVPNYIGRDQLPIGSTTGV